MKFILLCTLLLSIALIMAAAQEDSDRELYPQHNDHYRGRSVRSLTAEELEAYRKAKLEESKTNDKVGCCG